MDLEKASTGWKIPDSVIAQQRTQLAQPAKAAAARAPQASNSDETTWRPAPVHGNHQTQAAEESEPPADEQQLTSLRKLCAALGREEPAAGVLTFAGAAALIRRMSREYNQRRASV